MRTLLKGLFLSCVLAALSGCGVTGKWTMQSINPDSAKAHFNLCCMCLMDDGSYAACADEAGQMKCLKGTYKYDADAKTLTFTTDGKDRQYHAEVTSCGGELKLTGGEKGKEWTAVMKHAGACAPDQCCGGKGCGAKCGKSCDPKKCDPAKCPAAKGAKADEKKPEPAKGDPKK